MDNLVEIYSAVDDFMKIFWQSCCQQLIAQGKKNESNLLDYLPVK